MALLFVQLPARQGEQVVLLPPHAIGISSDDGGKFVQLMHAPDVLALPWPVPKPLPSGIPWYVDVENFGPKDVTLRAGPQFSIRLRPKDTVRILVQDSGYVIKR